MPCKYALLFYNPPRPQIPASQREATIAKMLAEMRAWHDGAAARRRVPHHACGWRRRTTATSLRQRAGDVLVLDGPFAETKEILGGLTVLECADLDEALGWARRCPLVRAGTVEVRPEWGSR